MQYRRFEELLLELELELELERDAGLPSARLRRKKYLSSSLLITDELGFEPMDRKEASSSSGPDLSLRPRFHAYHHQQEHSRLARATSRRQCAVHRDLRLLLHEAHILNIMGRSYGLRGLEDARTQTVA